MILADYDFNDKLGAAFRIPSTRQSTENVDFDMITIAPNYSKLLTASELSLSIMISIKILLTKMNICC